MSLSYSVGSIRDAAFQCHYYSNMFSMVALYTLTRYDFNFHFLAEVTAYKVRTFTDSRTGMHLKPSTYRNYPFSISSNFLELLKMAWPKL